MNVCLMETRLSNKTLDNIDSLLLGSCNDNCACEQKNTNSVAYNNWVKYWHTALFFLNSYIVGVSMSCPFCNRMKYLCWYFAFFIPHHLMAHLGWTYLPAQKICPCKYCKHSCKQCVPQYFLGWFDKQCRIGKTCFFLLIVKNATFQKTQPWFQQTFGPEVILHQRRSAQFNVRILGTGLCRSSSLKLVKIFCW